VIRKRLTARQLEFWMAIHPVYYQGGLIEQVINVDGYVSIQRTSGTLVFDEGTRLSVSYDESKEVKTKPKPTPTSWVHFNSWER